jgi:uncharacterized protein
LILAFNRRKDPLAQPDRLIVFTRYPEPGNTKTRLIPALGAEGAALLQRQMTEHTLTQVKALANCQPLSVELWFASSNSLESEQHDRQLMQTWLGTEWNYQRQGAGDLGIRMAAAFEAAFTAGIERAVTIGTDCPGLNTVRLAQAFQLLETHDLVLGPATDGGYYLIGLRRFIAALFVGIAWGTADVFSNTVEIARGSGLSIATLDSLADVDRPEDLVVWESILAETTCCEKK